MHFEMFIGHAPFLRGSAEAHLDFFHLGWRKSLNARPGLLAGEYRAAAMKKFDQRGCGWKARRKMLFVGSLEALCVPPLRGGVDLHEFTKLLFLGRKSSKQYPLQPHLGDEYNFMNT